jgi:hypothetical protein
MKLVAFWKYDIYPYVLYGSVEKINPESGQVYVPTYQGWFNPLAIYPYEKANEVIATLNNLVEKHKDRIRAAWLQSSLDLAGSLPFELDHKTPLVTDKDQDVIFQGGVSERPSKA